MNIDHSNRFRGRRFPDEIIVLCVRWYLRYCLSYRDLAEMMAERGVSVDHSTIARWVLHVGPILNEPDPARDASPEPFVEGRRNLHSRCRALDLFI